MIQSKKVLLETQRHCPALEPSHVIQGSGRMLVVAIGRLGKGLQARSDYRQVAGVLGGGVPRAHPKIQGSAQGLASPHTVGVGETNKSW